MLIVLLVVSWLFSVCVGCFGSFVFILCCEVEVSAGLGEFVFLFQVLSVFQSCSARPECLSFLKFFFGYLSCVGWFRFLMEKLDFLVVSWLCWLHAVVG